MSNNPMNNAPTSIPAAFDAYVVFQGEALIGYGISWEQAEKMARAENCKAKLGLKLHEINAQSIKVDASEALGEVPEYLAEYGPTEADKSDLRPTAARALWSKGQPCGGAGMDADALGAALLHIKRLSHARICRVSSSRNAWCVVEGFGHAEVYMTTDGKGFVSGHMGTRLDAKGGGVAGITFGSYNAARAALSRARQEFR